MLKTLGGITFIFAFMYAGMAIDRIREMNKPITERYRDYNERPFGFGDSPLSLAGLVVSLIILIFYIL